MPCSCSVWCVWRVCACACARTCGGAVSVLRSNFVGGLGGYGVAVGNASSDVYVGGCLFDSVGQGGVVAYGFDTTQMLPAGEGRARGYNTKPKRVHVSHNVMHNLGWVFRRENRVAYARLCCWLMIRCHRS
jgi:hypothetical protein